MRNLLLFTALKMSFQIIYQHIWCNTKCKSYIILSCHHFNLLLFILLICNTLGLKTHACLQGKAPPNVDLYLYIKNTSYHLNQYKVQISLFDTHRPNIEKAKTPSLCAAHVYFIISRYILKNVFKNYLKILKIF